jgi:hypothetical protein
MSEKGNIKKDRWIKSSSGAWSLILFLLMLLTGCEYEFPSTEREYSPGTLDLSSFVAVGDDYLAGFMDGALYTEGQQNGVSAIVADVLRQSGLEDFPRADICSANGMNVYDHRGDGIRGRYVLRYPDNQAEEPEITTLQGEEIPPYEGDVTAIRDLTIPFLKVWQVDEPSLLQNKYYERMALPAPEDLLTSRIRSLQPTSFLLWIGMSDIMGYAVSGGMGDTLLTGGADPGSTDLTPLDLFREKVDRLTEALLAVPESKGVIVTLPAFDDFPFFYYYAYDFIKLPGEKLPLARSMYKEFNEAVTASNQHPANPKRPYIDFNDNGYTPYPQPVVVHDSTLPDAYYPDGRPLEKYRQLQEGEMVLMSLPREMLQYGLGSLIPLGEQYYLNARQVSALRRRVEDFNTVLREKAAAYPGRLALAEVGEALHHVAMTGKLNGWGKPQSEEIPAVDGVPLQARLELYSIYSLDGLHLNSRGNAWIANMIVKATEQAFGSQLPPVDVNNYKGNVPLH